MKNMLAHTRSKVVPRAGLRGTGRPVPKELPPEIQHAFETLASARRIRRYAEIALARMDKKTQ